MATVHNRYFNNPAIAEAARSLASAFAPPDPDIIREREQNQFEFDYLKKKAGFEEADRRGNEIGLNALGELQKLRSNPIFKLDATGKPVMDAKGKPVVDTDAMDRKAYELAGVVQANAKDRFIRADLDQALYEASPKFRRQFLIQKFGAAYAAQRASALHGYRTEEAYTKGGIDAELDERNDKRAMDRVLAGIEGQKALWQMRINAAAKNNKVNPITLTPALIQQVGLQFRKLQRNAGAPLTDDELIQFTGEALTDLSTSRDPVNAANRVWAAHKLGGSSTPRREVDESGSWINWLIRLADPDFDPVANPFFGQTDTFLKSDPTPIAPPTPAGDVVPGSLGAASVQKPVTEPAGEAELMDQFRKNAEAETAKLESGKKPQTKKTPPAEGKKSPPPATTPSPKETPEERKARLRKILRGEG